MFQDSVIEVYLFFVYRRKSFFDDKRTSRAGKISTTARCELKDVSSLSFHIFWTDRKRKCLHANDLVSTEDLKCKVHNMKSIFGTETLD